MRRLLFALLVVLAAGSPGAATAQPACEPGAMRGVSFRHGDARPTGGALDRVVGSVARRLDACPGLGVVVRTYTDGTEPADLGEQRAEAVTQALAERGVVTRRLVVQSGGVHPDSDSRAAGEAGDARARRATVEAVALADLPGGPPDLSDPDPFTVELWQDGQLRLDWRPASDADACADGAALVLHAASYNGDVLDLDCLAADAPASYTDASTSSVVGDARRGVLAIDGRLGDETVGWVVGPDGSLVTDGRFCARYRAADRDARLALAGLVEAAGGEPVGDRFLEARAALTRAAQALLPFVEAVESVGGRVEGVALACRPLGFHEYSH